MQISTSQRVTEYVLTLSNEEMHDLIVSLRTLEYLAPNGAIFGSDDLYAAYRAVNDDWNAYDDCTALANSVAREAARDGRYIDIKETP